ncbi:GCN5-related protein N-acetyltransferase [Beutenbergia cavernae DSM 12333]|uniref:GCN5-related protein N-acetyltransferase n=1 Tax=Beutenbergia cavernae (strain ATCC BAA-8 / DSM 12333 / CCUG 43141 / JCM 11478 / NBRC 16432 / NCIMB 13614 / HKI 0122) TaxID=471853 RepID=C5BWF4_BEUC1|nr:GNAT family N-acetyltransferase [Beutenbergia cavernae]ACQ78612.1 GCN5-related protein N-acetyltransferase [Beutenbergia cavernae DSM 12333]
MSHLRLHEVTDQNLRALTDFQLKPGQERFVAPVVLSIAEAYVTPTAWPRAILEQDKIVGFVMANFDPDNEIEAFRCGIWRLNIAAHAQGRGVGRFAVEEVASEARKRGQDRMTVLWAEGEGGPESFYLRCGFEPTGERIFDQTLGVRTTAASAPRT